MKPLITFGQANEYGFDVNFAGQLIIMFNRSGTWENAPLTDDALKAIELHGGVSALVEQLHKIKQPKEKTLEQQTAEAFAGTVLEVKDEETKPAEEATAQAEAPQVKKRGRPKK